MAKITDWELGNDLAFIQDTIAEKIGDIADSRPEIAEMLHRHASEIGKAFNDLKAHDFGLWDWKSCKCKRCQTKRIIENYS